MEFEEYKKELIEYFQESVRLFSNKGKKNLELWIAKRFLEIMRVSYIGSNLQQPKDDPPDVIFSTASFEIMELYDDARRRHDEYKEKLKKVEAAKNYSEVVNVENWDLEPLSLEELLAVADEQLQKKKGNYSPDAKASLDVLIYVNLQKIIIDDEDLIFTSPIPQGCSFRQWRSVSLLFNRQIVCVAHASPSAPDFIQAHVGKVIIK